MGADVEDEFGLQRVLLEGHELGRLQLAVLQKGQTLHLALSQLTYVLLKLPRRSARCRLTGSAPRFRF